MRTALLRPTIIEARVMSLQVYLAYVVACFALALLPGPIVTLLLANGLRHGTRAGLINIAGVQLGLALVIAIIAVGLTTLMATMGYWFEWVRILGALYLVWLGIKVLREPVAVDASSAAPPKPPRGGFFLQGFLILLSNPKVLVFFGAFIPQFVDLNRPHFPQVMLLGVTFMATAAIVDSTIAILAGRARTLLSTRRQQLVSRLSGVLMIGGGVWLALSRAK